MAAKKGISFNYIINQLAGMIWHAEDGSDICKWVGAIFHSIFSKITSADSHWQQRGILTHPLESNWSVLVHRYRAQPYWRPHQSQRLALSAVTSVVVMMLWYECTMYICIKESCLAGWHHWRAFWQFAAAFMIAGMQCPTVCVCVCDTWWCVIN